MIVVDQIGRSLNMVHRPKTIVSLVPSVTELLFDLDLGNRVSAITDYCIHPAKGVMPKIKIGGPKNVDISKILSLNSDLIIASKEENVKEQIETLINRCNVYVSDVKNINNAINLIVDIGALTGSIQKSEIINSQIEAGFNDLKKNIKIKSRVVYLIWDDPLMTISSDTFINDILRLGGFENVFAYKSSRYPKISKQEIHAQNPDFIFLSKEPYFFSNEHVSSFSNEFPDCKTLLVDGEMFSWYGSHLLKVPDYFKHLL